MNLELRDSFEVNHFIESGSQVINLFLIIKNCSLNNTNNSLFLKIENGNIYIENSSFINNNYGSEGLFFLSQITNFTLIETSFIRNSALSEVSKNSLINFYDSVAIINNCFFKENLCEACNGGCVYVSQSMDKSISIKNSQFFNNIANYGGCIYFIQQFNSMTPLGNILFNNSYENNKAKSDGGALYLKNVQLKMLNSIFINNNALGPNLETIMNMTYSDLLTGQGGAIYYDSGFFINNLTIEDIILKNSKANIGGALYINKKAFVGDIASIYL